MDQLQADSPTPGRSSIFTLELAELLALLIRQTGLSDSAAARDVGLSTSSLSRWKQQSPAFALSLLQAREAFRRDQLDVILAASRAPGTGWRAAAWLLERLFPEDYHPNATQRAKHQQLAAARDAEADALIFPEAEEPLASPSASAPASQNSRNSPFATPERAFAEELPRHTPPPPYVIPAQNSQKSRPPILSSTILAA